METGSNSAASQKGKDESLHVSMYFYKALFQNIKVENIFKKLKIGY